MLRGTAKKELEGQLKQALALIINKLASDGVENLRVDDCLKVELVDASDGCSLGYDCVDDRQKAAADHMAWLRKIGVDTHDIEMLYQADNAGVAETSQFLVKTNDLLKSYLNSKKEGLFEFPVSWSAPDSNLSVGDKRDWAYLQAKNSEKMVQSFNTMLSELGIDYVVKMPNKRDTGRGA